MAVTKEIAKRQATAATHTLTHDEVHAAVMEVVNKYHTIASASTRHNGWKVLAYNPFTCTFRVRTNMGEETFRGHGPATDHYNSK